MATTNNDENPKKLKVLGIPSWLWLLGALAVFILGIGVFAGTVWIVNSPDLTSGTAQAMSTYLTWGLLALTLTASVVVGILMILAVAFIIRWLAKIMPIFGGTVIDRLIGLAIVVLLFRAAFATFLYKTAWIIVSLWAVLPSTLVHVIERFGSTTHLADDQVLQVQAVQQAI